MYTILYWILLSKIQNETAENIKSLGQQSYNRLFVWTNEIKLMVKENLNKVPLEYKD